jgi:hypothetical protein
MRSAGFRSVLLALGLSSLYVGEVFAEQVPTQNTDSVEGRCGASGGVFFPKTGANSTYGCINKDGSGIVCGGVTAKDKKTCETFLNPPPRLPTRQEAELGARMNASPKIEQTK